MAEILDMNKDELFRGKMKFSGVSREIEPLPDLQYALEFTRAYRAESNKYLREAKCLKLQVPYVLSDIQADEKIVGLCTHGFVGFSPQWGGLYTYYFHRHMVELALEAVRDTMSHGFIEEVNEMIEFWEDEATIERHKKQFKSMYPNSVVNRGYTEPGLANADVRLAGTTVDLDKLIRLGVKGLRKDLHDNKGKFIDLNLFEAMDSAIDTITMACNFYIDKINHIEDAERKQQLGRTLSALKNIRTEAPQTFFEGLQLVWIYAMISDLLNYGRMDVVLGDLYVSDLEKGISTEEDAVNDILSLYTQMRKICKKHDARVIVGGRGRRNEENADKVAILFMEASRRFYDIVPQLTFRYYTGCNDDVYNKALKINGEGCTFPIIYSDETNIPAVMKVYGVSYEEACNYLPFGCGEYVLEGYSTGTPNNGINMLKALEIALHSGFDVYWNKITGKVTKKVEDIKDFDDLFTQFENQVKPYVEWLAWHKKLNYTVAAEQCGFLHLSLLMNDCFKNGKALLEGGVRYLNASSEVFGIVSTADSLTAIKKLVYDEKIFTLAQIVEMMDANFEGHEKERKMLIDAPKYGNDNDYADEIAIRVFNFIADETMAWGEKVGLNRYNIVSVNNSMSAEWGYYIGATPCGRLKSSAMSNGNGCSIGADKSGVTSLLNSMSKIDASKHVGVIHNVRFTKDMFKNDFDKVKLLLTTFYENNGVQTNIDCIGKDDLVSAMKEPEKYQNLIVRIGGFSEKFIELNTITQLELIERTIYES